MYNKEEIAKQIERAKKEFPIRLQNLRKEQHPNKPVQAVAKIIDIAPASLGNKYENKTSPSFPRCEQLIMLKHFYNVPYEYLLNETDSKVQENIIIESELGLNDTVINILKEISKKAKNDLDFQAQNTINAINKIIESAVTIINQSNEETVDINDDSFLINLANYIALPIDETNDFTDKVKNVTNEKKIKTHKEEVKYINDFYNFNIIKSLNDFIDENRKLEIIREEYKYRQKLNRELKNIKETD